MTKKPNSSFHERLNRIESQDRKAVKRDTPGQPRKFYKSSDTGVEHGSMITSPPISWGLSFLIGALAITLCKAAMARATGPLALWQNLIETRLWQYAGIDIFFGIGLALMFKTILSLRDPKSAFLIAGMAVVIFAEPMVARALPAVWETLFPQSYFVDLFQL